MQVGFMLLEVGCVRAQHAKAICVKNAVDFLICTMTWLCMGYAFAFGERGALGDFAGTSYFFGIDLPSATEGNLDWNMWYFQWTFASATCTIVSGAGAERCAFKGYLVSTFLLSFFIYPVIVHWVWSGDPWLASGDFKFFDFAGSGVVHLTGGVCAFMMASICGARDGRFDKDGRPMNMSPHNLVLASWGTLFLVMGWFGFNGGSVLAASGGNSAMAGKIVVVTAIGAATGGIASFGFVWATSRFIMLEALTNGMLAGLVSVTGGASVLTPGMAAIVGFLGGLIYQCSSKLLLHFQIDDPLDASPIHGVCGFWGLLAVGLFASEGGVTGLFFGDGEQLGHQLFGALVIATFAGGVTATVFSIMRYFKKLRVPLSIEITGDLVLYGGSAYPQFEKSATPADGELCVVAVRVEGAAALWEWNDEIMTVAVQTFKRIVCDNAARDQGYEILEEDNAITLVFNNAFDATKFALGCQTDLFKADWPEALLEHPLGSKDSQYCGLRICMAVVVGNAEKKMVGHRLNYIGPGPDQCAALIGSIEEGGTVVMPTNTLSSLQANFSHRSHELGQHNIQDLGKYQVEGIEDPIALMQILPAEVANRTSSRLKGTMLAKSFAMAPGVAVREQIALIFCNFALASKKKPSDEQAKLTNDLLNTVTFEHEGYVTKTSNGVSLLSFPNGQCGLEFIADITARLQEPDFSVFKFIAGLHVGVPISVAPNKASGRADYLGPVCNATARLMALAGDKSDLFMNGHVGGAISVDVFNQCDAATQGSRLKEIGVFELKGLSEGMKTYAYIPSSDSLVQRAAEPATSD